MILRHCSVLQQASHPQTKVSLARFADWGVEVVPPQITEQQVTMAPIATILQVVLGGEQ